MSFAWDITCKSTPEAAGHSVGGNQLLPQVPAAAARCARIVDGHKKPSMQLVWLLHTYTAATLSHCFGQGACCCAFPLPSTPAPFAISDRHHRTRLPANAGIGCRAEQCCSTTGHLCQRRSQTEHRHQGAHTACRQSA